VVSAEAYLVISKVARIAVNAGGIQLSQKKEKKKLSELHMKTAQKEEQENWKLKNVLTVTQKGIQNGFQFRRIQLQVVVGTLILCVLVVITREFASTTA